LTSTKKLVRYEDEEHLIGAWCRVPGGLHASNGRPGIYLGRDETGIAVFGCGTWRSTTTMQHLEFISQSKAVALLLEWEERMARHREAKIKALSEEMANDYYANRNGEEEGIFLYLARKRIEQESKDG